MTLDKLLKDGHNKTGFTPAVRSFNDMESPVPCSSDVWISPDTSDHPNVIKKTKKKGKRPKNGMKMAWEFLQYEALNRVFWEYFEKCDKVHVMVPEPIAVYPTRGVLYTEFMPGFILRVLRDPEKAKDVKVADIFGKARIEHSIAFHLGYLSKIKEIEGIYHSDFDLRHVIFNAEDAGIGMFDLENTRYTPEKRPVEIETANIMNEWFEIAESRGCNRRYLETRFEMGREAVTRPKKPIYTKILRKVGKEYGITIKPTVGFLDNKDVGLQKVKLKIR